MGGKEGRSGGGNGPHVPAGLGPGGKRDLPGRTKHTKLVRRMANCKGRESPAKRIVTKGTRYAMALS